jgi:hypothetical protein
LAILKRPGLVVEYVIGNLEEARLSGICDWQS